MVSFNSLKSVQGFVTVPAVHGEIVFWHACGACSRVPASFDSFESLCRALREWSFSWDSVVSCSFWCGSVLVARSWGGFAVSLGACSDSDVWRVRRYVS